MASQDMLSLLLERMRSAWEGQEDAVSCACRFLAGVEGVEQEEQLGRLLSFVEALRCPLVERLQGHGNHHGGDDGTVEEASRKRGRCGAGNGRVEPEETREAGPKDKTQSAFSSPLSGTAAAAPPPEATQEGLSRAVKGVLLDQDLLACAWGFVLGGTGRQDVCVLGQLSLVCRKWREVGAWDAWWGRIEEDMLPMLWEDVRGKAASSRGRVLQYGRFLEGERGPLDGQEEEGDWLQGLEGHVEIFDHMDGLQILFMRGPVTFSQEDREVAMAFRADSPGMQVKGAAFSAASRDPLRRFSTIEAYVERGDREEYPCCLCIRVTVRDMRTGRMAVVWQQSKPDLYVIEREGDGGFFVRGNRGECQKRLRRLLRTGGAFFDIVCVSNQGEDLDKQDVLYRINPHTVEINFKSMSNNDYAYLGLIEFGGILQAVLV